MIKRLRSRFIRIATLSVAAVMLLLTVILNVVNHPGLESGRRPAGHGGRAAAGAATGRPQ